MRLYLVQHGEAVPKDVDPKRPLSLSGRADVERVAAFLGCAGVRVARVVHSGKLRAHQTAELLARAVAPKVPVQARSGIDPMDAPEPLAREAAGWTEDTMLVGHQPFMGRLVSFLVSCDSEGEVVNFQSGTMACVERTDASRWVVAWVVRPELLSAEDGG